MNRQSQYKKKFDPETGKFTHQHIYGEGYKMDILKSLGKKALTEATKKTGEYIGKKAGDKIVSMLKKDTKQKPNTSKKMTTQQRNARVNSILTGGKII